MAGDMVLCSEEMAIDEGLGYPKAYAKLCKDPSFRPYSRGPPFTFTPYALPQHEVLRAKELDAMFPIIDPNAKPTTKPKIFLSLLWKQLNHIGNAGFDPEIFRVDSYGNVLYYHADSASPLAWDIDHWFPCSRGGRTVPSNLRILQWQACKKKNNKLEFLIPWWDLHVGISINQFLSIFASSNSDFRRRAFSWLFSEGESEELNASQTVDSHVFPHHFVESQEKIGLAPAAVVLSRRESLDSNSALKSLDINRRPRSNTHIVACKRTNSNLKENESPDMVSNPYQAIVMARDSLRHKEETSKIQAEMHKLDDEVGELKHKTEEDKASIQELELILIKKRRRAEKCRKLAEAQSSYRAMIEKMIRDAMHQSVVYKEQVRLNQAAANALMARLEAQRAICDSAEKQLHRKFKQRDELEQQIRPEWEQTRKRSRLEDFPAEEKIDMKTPLYLPENSLRTELDRYDEKVLYLPDTKTKDIVIHKDLREFLNEEQKAYETGLSLNDDQQSKTIVQAKDENSTEEIIYNNRFPILCETEKEEDDESRKKRGKGNLDKWLQFLWENSQEEPTDLSLQEAEDNEDEADGNANNASEIENGGTNDVMDKLNLKYPHKEIKISRPEKSQSSEDVRQLHQANNQKEVVLQQEEAKAKEISELKDKSTPSMNPPYKLYPERSRASDVSSASKGGVKARSSSCERSERRRSDKEKELLRSDSVRLFRRIPSSPSLLLSGMKKRVDWIGGKKKASVIRDDDGDERHAEGGSFIKSSIKTIRKAVKI